jgi:benzyl alcohol O-benzoyltransferase
LGESCYGGIAKGADVAILGQNVFHIPFKNAKGEEGLVIPLFLPAQVMERLVKELDSVLMCNINEPTKGDPKSGVLKSLNMYLKKCFTIQNQN